MAMEARDVLDILLMFEQAGIETWVEGGWGIDALLGAQNRDHGDLDLLVDTEAAEGALAMLASAGFQIIFDEGPGHYSLHDGRHRVVDLNVAVGDRYGDRWNLNRQFGRGEPDYMFDCFTYGWIAGHRVACLGPETQISHHLGYEIEDVDKFDIKLIHERFDVAVPQALR